MNNKINSIHLQKFPDLSFIDSEEDLVINMDKVRDICSTALFIRDKNNLRVRLPLNSLEIIGKDAYKISNFVKIISEEVNVKNIIIRENIDKLAELKLQINFKEVAKNFPHKMKNIIKNIKENNWERLEDSKIKLDDIILNKNEFNFKLVPKDTISTASLSTNDCLVKLDINVTEELEEEGISRDIIRIIQQERKIINLNVSDKIKIFISNPDKRLEKIVKQHKRYIEEQTLSIDIEFSSKCDIAYKSSKVEKILFTYFVKKI